MSDFSAESLMMTSLRKIGMEGAAWSMRRLHCPVNKDALVLEVGSGGSPYARANVLLDAYDSTRERHWVPLVVDRPMVLGFVEQLPFKDKSFDFVIASHVLEHSSRPEKFLSELQRVAKAGYIEVPDAFMERVNPYKDHRLEITERDGKLIIKKKPDWIVEKETVELYKHKVKPIMTKELIPSRPFAFHVRYYWKDQIDFEVVNQNDDASWEPVESTSAYTSMIQKGTSLKGILLRYLRSALSQQRRNKSIDIMNLIVCPNCNSDELHMEPELLTCTNCSAKYNVENGVPLLFKSHPVIEE